MEKDDLHRASASGSASPAPDVDYDDPVEARRVVRKVDWRLIPLLTFLYTLTFLDRVNIGNARLWNLEKDLRMSGYDYNLAVLVFYIPYILLEVSSWRRSWLDPY
jgi:MFS transporter, ACS family, DAL5 transporter family protein